MINLTIHYNHIKILPKEVCDVIRTYAIPKKTTKYPS
jgi:hypothetical protein